MHSELQWWSCRWNIPFQSNVIIALPECVFIGLQESNDCWSDDSEERRWLIDFGICFMIAGGWFDWLFMYCGSLFGFLWGFEYAIDQI